MLNSTKLTPLGPIIFQRWSLQPSVKYVDAHKEPFHNLKPGQHKSLGSGVSLKMHKKFTNLKAGSDSDFAVLMKQMIFHQLPLILTVLLHVT